MHCPLQHPDFRLKLLTFISQVVFLLVFYYLAWRFTLSCPVHLSEITMNSKILHYCTGLSANLCQALLCYWCSVAIRVYATSYHMKVIYSIQKP